MPNVMADRNTSENRLSRPDAPLHRVCGQLVRIPARSRSARQDSTNRAGSPGQHAVQKPEVGGAT
jgi:hypothetical protein